MKGSHSTALVDTLGLWEETGSGTLLFDEIGDLSLAHQVKILRVLQEGVIRRLGGKEEIPVSARIIAATNKNLKQLIVENKFREDLFSRLDVITITPPPLRSHPEDIPLIAQKKWHSVTGGKRSPLTGHVLSKLSEYHWPGNVRELENVIKKLHFLNPYAEEITPMHVERVLSHCNLSDQLKQLAMRIKNDFELDLWVEHGTRDFSPHHQKFYLGDKVNICAKTTQKCQLWIINVGSSGEINIISHNDQVNNYVDPDQEIRISGTLKGAVGTETFFAFGSTQPLNFVRASNPSSEQAIRDFISNTNNILNSKKDAQFATKNITFEILPYQ
jgi:hypothetical protein